MQGLVRRLAALLLALLLALGGLTGAVAEDWRALLRDLYGLTEDYDGGEDALPAEEILYELGRGVLATRCGGRGDEAVEQVDIDVHGRMMVAMSLSKLSACLMTTELTPPSMARKAPVSLGNIPLAMTPSRSSWS